MYLLECWQDLTEVHIPMVEGSLASELNYRFKITCVSRKMQICCAGAEVHEKTRITCVWKKRSLASLLEVTELVLRVWGGDVGTGTRGQFRAIGFVFRDWGGDMGTGTWGQFRVIGFLFRVWGPGHGDNLGLLAFSLGFGVGTWTGTWGQLESVANTRNCVGFVVGGVANTWNYARFVVESAANTARFVVESAANIGNYVRFVVESAERHKRSNFGVTSDPKSETQANPRPIPMLRIAEKCTVARICSKVCVFSLQAVT